MRKSFTLLIFLFSGVVCFCQVPEYISYQAIARDATHRLIKNEEISIRLSLLPGKADTLATYTETHTLTTDSSGVFTLQIGTGTTDDDFTSIDWSPGQWFLRSEFDFTGGDNYILSTVNEFLSVPYSFVAGVNLGVKHLTFEEIAKYSPPAGAWAYLTDRSEMVYFDGHKWNSFATGDCFTQATLSEAGPDKYYMGDTLSAKITGNKPQTGKGKWKQLHGEAGTFENDTLRATIFTAPEEGDYIVGWEISTLCDTSMAPVYLGFGLDSVGSFVDARDNQTYEYVLIGEQVWMAENLNYYTDTGSVYYFNDSNNYHGFGRLYNWNTASTSCPENWHVPTEMEWNQLFNHLGGIQIAGIKMKSFDHWPEPDVYPRNESGFNALPSGEYSFGQFKDHPSKAIYWTDGIHPEYEAKLTPYLEWYEEEVSISYTTDYRSYFAVRCIRDFPVRLPEVIEKPSVLNQ